MMEGSERGWPLGAGPILRRAGRRWMTLVLHDEFLHTLRLFLDFHDYDQGPFGHQASRFADRPAGMQEMGEEGRRRRNRPARGERGAIPPPTLGHARRRSLALTAVTSSWVGA